MKVKLLVLVGLVLIVGCSLFSSPQATAKKFMSAAEKGDVDTMTKLFSSRAVRRDGLDKIREDNKKFAKVSTQSNASESYEITNLTESKEGINARVGFLYRRKDRTVDSIRIVFALTQEGGSWKIDNIGGPELEEIKDLGSAELKDPPKKLEPSESVPTLQEPVAPPPPPSTRAPISGGVLNGKAISLPKPPYPPIARATKASGTVVVQVTVDENGNVISAHAVSGHPLLQAASVAAARAAKFPPTKLAGQPVKVNGVINYVFEPPAN